MTTHIPAEPLRPVDALDALIAHHGLMRIILALPAALLKQRRDRVTMGYALSPYLQRDIGIPPDPGRYREMR